MRTAIVLGSTGLVGSELVKLLQASPRYGSIVLLNRRPSGFGQEKIVEHLINFDAPELSGITGDDLYCALGTTRRKAGSQAAQHKIDYEYPALIAERLRKKGVVRIALVSSVGADAQARNFYLRTKGQLEEKIVSLGFAQTALARPSFLIGARSDFRLGESVGILLLKIVAPLLIGRLRKYRGIQASEVARRLVEALRADTPGVQVIEFD